MGVILSDMPKVCILVLYQPYRIVCIKEGKEYLYIFVEYARIYTEIYMEETDTICNSWKETWSEGDLGLRKKGLRENLTLGDF